MVNRNQAQSTTTASNITSASAPGCQWASQTGLWETNCSTTTTTLDLSTMQQALLRHSPSFPKHKRVPGQTSGALATTTASGEDPGIPASSDSLVSIGKRWAKTCGLARYTLVATKHLHPHFSVPDKESKEGLLQQWALPPNAHIAPQQVRGCTLTLP